MLAGRTLGAGYGDALEYRSGKGYHIEYLIGQYLLGLGLAEIAQDKAAAHDGDDRHGIGHHLAHGIGHRPFVCRV